MIRRVRGDLLASDAEMLVNTVNCVGAMGKGIALKFKRRFPDMFADYQRRCDAKLVQPGIPYAYREGDRTIANFPTKQHWRGSSRINYIVEGVPLLALLIEELEVSSVAVPPLGCGHGGLDWAEVQPIIEAGLQGVAAHVYLYVPDVAEADVEQLKLI